MLVAMVLISCGLLWTRAGDCVRYCYAVSVNLPRSQGECTTYLGSCSKGAYLF